MRAWRQVEDVIGKRFRQVKNHVSNPEERDRFARGGVDDRHVAEAQTSSIGTPDMQGTPVLSF